MNAYERLKKNKIKKLSEKAQDLFHLMHSFGKRKNNKLCKCFDSWKPYANVKNRDLWTYQIYFYENVFFPTKIAKFAATTTWQTATSRHFLMNFLRLTEKETNKWWTNTLDKNKLTWRDHNDWPEPINQSWFMQNWWLWTASAFVGKNNSDKKQTDKTFFGKG